MRSIPRSGDAGGLTLVELIVAVTLAVAVVSIAIPQVIAWKRRSNEAAAISQLRAVSSSQTQFRASGLADEDFDGTGEFGTFAEMGGRVGIRGLSVRVPADLTVGMSMVDVAGEVRVSGYVFRLYLPKEDGRGQREQPYGGLPGSVVDPDLAELHWACYAWPESSGITGDRTFFLNDAGQVLSSVEPQRTGQNSAYVRAGDAFRSDDPDAMTGPTAVGTTGSDGNDWTLVR